MEQENNVKSRFKSVCVYCGSSYGKRDCYREAAVELGQELGKQRLDLVYGGGGIGLMGLVARTVHGSGGRVKGIIPKALIGKEKTGETVGELTVVANMHHRKAEMARHADCFIALPGGYGTMEELLEVIRWAQLGIHDKPVGLLNVDGYYNHLLTFIDKAVEDGFIKPSRGHIYVSAPNAKELVQKLEDKSCGEVPLQPLPPPPSIGASDTENTIGESSAAATVPESVQLPLQPPPPLLDDTSIHPPPPSEVAPAKGRRSSGPCYGWIESDEEDGDLELIDLPPMVMMMKRRDVKPGDV